MQCEVQFLIRGSEKWAQVRQRCSRRSAAGQRPPRMHCSMEPPASRLPRCRSTHRSRPKQARGAQSGCRFPGSRTRPRRRARRATRPSRGSRAPDHAGVSQQRQLDCHAPDSACRPRDEDRVTLLHVCDVDDPDVRREPSHPQHAERGRHRRDRRVDGAHPAAADDRRLAPAVVMDDPRAFGPPVVPRRDDPAHGTAAHRLPERERRHVGLGVVHPAAHVRVDRDVRVADKDVAVPQLREEPPRPARSPTRAARRSGERRVGSRATCSHGRILRRSDALRNLPRPLLPCRAAFVCRTTRRPGPCPLRAGGRRSALPKGA